MAIEKLSEGQLHKKLKALIKKYWESAKAKFSSDVAKAIKYCLERLDRSVRVTNIEMLLERRGRGDLIACAYNAALRGVV